MFQLSSSSHVETRNDFTTYSSAIDDKDGDILIL